MKYKNAKTTKANCGASVKAASGGYMSVSGNGIKVDDMKSPKAGYSRGGVLKDKPKNPSRPNARKKFDQAPKRAPKPKGPNHPTKGNPPPLNSGKPKGPAPYDDSGTSPKKSPKPQKKTKSSTQGTKSGPKPKTGGTSKPTSKKAPMYSRGSGKGARRR